MEVIFDYQSGFKPIIRFEAENDDEKYALRLMWNYRIGMVSYNNNEKLAITCGPEEKADT